MTMLTKLQMIIKLSVWVFVFSLFAVSCSIDGVGYNRSADVSQREWRPTDTLVFDFYVADSLAQGDYDKLLRNRYYGMTISVRYTDNYKYTTIPLHVRIDTTRQVFVRPEPNRPATWGAIMQEEFVVSGFYQAFADTGSHRIIVYPDTVLTGICSLGVELQMK